MKVSKWLKLGIVILSAGFLIVAFVVIFNGFGVFKKDIIEKSYDVEESFNSINFDVEESDINIFVSEDGTNKITTKEKKKITFDISIINDVLTIKEVGTYISLLDFTSTEVNLYVNKQVFENLIIDGDTSDINIASGFTFNEVKIIVSTGDVKLSNLNANQLDIELSTGDSRLDNISVVNNVNIKRSTGSVVVNKLLCGGNVYISGSTGETEIYNCRGNNITFISNTGDIEAFDLIASGDLKIEGSTSDIELDNCDAANIYIETSTGDVEATILTVKIFDVDTSTGEKEYPASGNGGVCKVRTSTGDIELSYAK